MQVDDDHGRGAGGGGSQANPTLLQRLFCCLAWKEPGADDDHASSNDSAQGRHHSSSNSNANANNKLATGKGPASVPLQSSSLSHGGLANGHSTGGVGVGNGSISSNNNNSNGNGGVGASAGLSAGGGGGIAALATQVQQGQQIQLPAHFQRPTRGSIISSVSSTVPGLPGGRFLLGPQTKEDILCNRKTLVLDLDETLVHSSFKPIPNADFVLSIDLEGVTHRVYVRKRPGVDHFLRYCAEKFEIVIFTASLAKYADPLLDILDKDRVCRARLFREACVQHYNNYIKDLTHLGRKLENSIIVDNSPFSYMFQPENAIPITSWFHDRSDRELYDLLPFLDEMAECSDIVAYLAQKKLQFLNGTVISAA